MQHQEKDQYNLEGHIYQMHDAYGKDALLRPEVILDCIKGHIDEGLEARIDFESLQLVQTGFVYNLLQYHSDIIYRAHIDNEDDYIYFIIELQSTSDRLMSLRMQNYLMLLVDQHLRKYKDKDIPFIIPICMHNDTKPYPYSTSIYDCVSRPELARRYRIFDQFTLWDLSQLSVQELLNHGKSGLFQALYKHGKKGDFLQVVRQLTPEYIQSLDPEYVYSSAKYIYHQGEAAQAKESLELLSNLVKHTSTKEKIMSYAESLVQKGRQEGRQTGRQEGIREIAKRLIQQGVALRTISVATGLQHEELAKLS